MPRKVSFGHSSSLESKQVSNDWNVSMMEHLLRVLVREGGATATEYALLVAGAALMISAVIYQTGDQLAGFWSELGIELFE